MSLKKAKEVIKIETTALKNLSKNLDRQFTKAVDLIVKCKGRVVVSGMGKTGIIGRKIAATLSSTGTPSIFMHSAEAVHGDLGQLTKDDILILISYSGETEETKRLLPLVKRIKAKIIAMTGNPKSSLVKESDVFLNVAVKEEGCPLGLAPMASTTATLVMGDALAASLIVRKNFKRENFAFYHPGGALGKKLLLKVEDIMRKGTHFAKVRETAKVKNVLLAITKARCGSACVVDAKGKLAGIFTDGDLRRHMEKGSDILTKPVKDVMTKKPTSVSKDMLAIDAMTILEERNIDELPVLGQKSELVGILDIQDLLKVGLV
ncbi:MAG: KpsF/GutQ family sugar-phosphate isomerase [Candidatus Omnitrophica bacterium]|nr:KpsF/GutQ family sugar-phosphate isomerase [Candidatus Omnitrophota bacterium]